MKALSVSLLSLILLVSATSAATALKNDSYEPVTLEQRLELPLPNDMRGISIQNPHAQIFVEVNEEGTVIDAMPFKASHFKLLPYAVKLVKETQFTPARLNGKAVQGKAAVYVNFFDGQQLAWKSGIGVLPFGGSASDAALSRFYQIAPSRYTYGESKPKDLDSPLKLKEAKLRIYESEPGVRAKGSCVVEYYVGPDGEVHFPKIIQSDHDDISTSAFMTLQVTKFEPPTSNGNPTCVLVRQPFKFN